MTFGGDQFTVEHIRREVAKLEAANVPAKPCAKCGKRFYLLVVDTGAFTTPHEEMLCEECDPC